MYKNRNKIAQYKYILILILAHLLSAILVLIDNKNNLTQELYGIWGRSNGFFTLLSYLILITATLFYPIKRHLNSFIKLSLYIGLLTLNYGVLQYLKLVKIANLNGENTQSSGFFGNENFYSALLGIISVISLSVALGSSLSKIRNIFPYLFPIFALFGIHLANSQQGYLVFAVGSIVVVFAFIKTSKLTKLLLPYILLSGSLLISIILGFFQMGPLSKYVYEETLTFRGFYWFAGIKMFRHDPILGLGFDSYRDYYRRFRSPDALSRLSPTDIPDSSHSYFIDTAVNGGLLLLLTYLLILFYVAYCSVQIIRKMNSFDAPKVAVVAAWYAFMTQAFVSLPQLGLTIWGWIISGLIIAIYKQTVVNKPHPTDGISIKPPALVMGILFVTGFIISVLPFKVSAEYRRAQENQNIETLINAAKMYPQDAAMLAAAGGALISINQNAKAKELLEISIHKFPQFYESWFIYSQLPGLTSYFK